MASFPSALITLLPIALGLSADCFAVAVGTSMAEKGKLRWRWLKFAASFGIFQATMLVIGWFAGRTIVEFVSGFDHWVAFGLLAFVGGKMIWESFHEKEETVKKQAASLLTLATLSVATSLDALAVGLSFAFLNVNLPGAAATVGSVSFLITALGFVIGRRAGGVLGRWAEIVGGLVLIGIGIRIVVEHLF